MTIPATAKEFIENIHQAVSSRKYEEAAALCSEGMRFHPQNLRLKIQHGVILRRSGELAAALDHYLSLRDSYPKVAELEFKLAEIAIANNEMDEAERRIEAASAKGGARKMALLLRATVAKNTGDKLGESALLESVLEESDAMPVNVAVRLATVYSQQKDYKKAHDLLLRVLEVTPDNVNAHAALASVAELIGDGILAERELLRLIEIVPDRPNWYARAQKLYLHLGQPDKAEKVLRTGLSKGLVGAVLFGQLTNLPPIADLADLILCWARSVDGRAAESEWTVAQRILFHYAPSTVTANSDTGVSIEERQLTDSDLLTLSPADKDLKRAVTLEQLSAEIQISRSPTSDCVVLVFLGLANRAMLPIRIFDRYLAALDCSAIYIADNSRLLGNRGIASVGETFDDTIRYLQNMIAELRVQRCITIGSSAGGYPALRYGLQLSAEKILSFSGPTNITAEFLANDGRGAIIARRLQDLPRETLDMKPRVLDANGQTKIHLIYGEDNPQDKMHALYLQGSPEVHLHPLKGLKEHGSILALAKQCSLMSTLRILIGTQA